ncbi:MAG: energy-coupling factor transporter transmembrane protein EcfT [Eubacterium sp.]|nr:energy-coupling factor transporter transmembrane protein EcfT [Eubacterium sp.]
MKVLDRIHPTVMLCYFVGMVILMIVLEHPVIYLFGGICALWIYKQYNPTCSIWKILWGSLGAGLVCVLVNPLLNHRGVTLLFMLGQWRITKEAVLYGCNMACLLLSSCIVFAAFSRCMTSEKIMMILAGHFPNLALVFSMILRLIPLQIRQIRNQYHFHKKHPFTIISAGIRNSLQEGMERGISMRMRGYGTGKRTSYYTKRFRWHDSLKLVLCVGMVLYFIFYCHTLAQKTRFFPSLQWGQFGMLQWIILTIYFMAPIILSWKETIRWNWFVEKTFNSASKKMERTF